MFTFSQRLMQNIFIGIVFLAITSIISLLMLTDHLSDKSKLDHQTVLTLVKNIPNESDPKYIEQQLQRSIKVKQLTITHLGQQAVNYQNKQMIFGEAWLSPGAKKLSIMIQISS